jgi:hypothetical protein
VILATLDNATQDEVQKYENNYKTLNDVALMNKLRYNLLSVSQLVDVDLDVIFRKFLILLANVFMASLALAVFQADFSLTQSSVKCLISQSLYELWKWHRRLGHLSFDLLCRLNGLCLLRELPLLKFESNLICAPCHHGKMIIVFYSPVNTMMTEQSRQLLDMDTVGPSRIHSIEDKWYVLIIIDDYSCYSWVFFLENKDEVFENFQSLALMLNNEHLNCFKAIHSENGSEFRNAFFDQFCLEHGVDQ